MQRTIAWGCMLWVAIGIGQAQEGSESVWSRSYALEAKGRYEQAAAVIAASARKGAHREFALLRTGWLLYLAGSLRDSERAYREALQLNPRSLDARLGLSLPLIAQHRWREAAQVLDEVLAISPEHPIAALRRMLCTQGMKQWRELEARAQMFVLRYPAQIDGWVFLARARTQLGDEEGAKKAWKEVLIRAPQHIEALRALRNE